VAKSKPTTTAELLNKQPLQSAALALAGEPLRAEDGGLAAEAVPGRVPRRRAGRGNEVSPAERRAIQLAVLAGPTISQDALAERFGRSRSTIRAVLADPSFAALQAEFDQATAIQARSILDSGRTAASSAWLASLDRAAQRGDHRPSRDLLYVTRTVDPPSQQGSGPQVIVNIGRLVTGGAAERDPMPIIEWRDDNPEDAK